MKRIVLNSLLCVCAASAGQAYAAMDEGMQQYRESLAGAHSTFKADLAHCGQLKGQERDLCKAQAKAVHRKATADAIAAQRNTPQARVDARIAAADADYDVASTACKADRGNERAACMKQAKEARMTATRQAAADLQLTESRNRAKEQKRRDYYRASRAKCDALAGAAKEACMTLARAQYGE